MSTVYTFTDDQLLNVSHVLFGLQKQASVINAAVVKIVARGLVDVAGESCLNSEQSVIDTSIEYLQTLCDNGMSGDHTFVMLLAGEQSLANLLEVGPKTVFVSRPNLDSPKHTFRVGMLGEEPEVDKSAETLGDVFKGMGMSITGTDTTTPVDTSGKPVVTHHAQGTSTPTNGCPYNPTDDYVTRARKIKDAILPLCPNAVKTEIPDNEYAQALCMAEYYYKNISQCDVPSAPVFESVSENVQIHPMTKQRVYEMYNDGASINELAEYCDVTPDEVKGILKEKGITVDFGDSLPVKVAVNTTDAIFYMHNAGASVDEIAHALGLTQDKVRNSLLAKSANVY